MESLAGPLALRLSIGISTLELRPRVLVRIGKAMLRGSGLDCGEMRSSKLVGIQPGLKARSETINSRDESQVLSRVLSRVLHRWQRRKAVLGVLSFNEIGDDLIREAVK